MKGSYKIIISLAVVLVLGISALLAFEYSKNRNNDTQTLDSNQEDYIETDIESDEDKRIIPFTSIVEYDGTLYTSRSISKIAAVEDAEIIPIDSEYFTIIDEDVYYITNGDEDFAPELRRCGIDGNTDISISEFVSPLGAPTVVGDSIYSAYYTQVDDGLNNGIYKIDIESSETEKVVDGEFFIYGYDKNKIYHTTNSALNSSSQPSGTVLLTMDYNGENSTEILNFSVRTDSIVVDEKYVFFSAYDSIAHCYKIYRSPKSGRGNIDEYAYECFTSFFDVIDGRLYYQANAAIYSSELNGDNETKVADLDENHDFAYGFLKFGDVLYFDEWTGDNADFYRLNLELNEKKKITK